MDDVLYGMVWFVLIKNQPCSNAVIQTPFEVWVHLIIGEAHTFLRFQKLLYFYILQLPHDHG